MPAKKNDAMGRVETKIDLFKEHFDEHMKTVGAKLEKMDDRLDNVDVTVARQQTILEEHVKRTNLLEEKLDKDVEPLKAQASQVRLLLKIAGLILGGGAAVSGAGWGIKELIALFTG
jgi:ribosome-associated translation inhibitor RaiA